MQEYGLLLGADVPNAGLNLSFYSGTIEEGHHLPFVCHGRAVLRTARIHPRAGDVPWLERHVRTTQTFLGLGGAPFGMVLGRPNHEAGQDVPDLDGVRALVFPPGHGILLHCGTWHDFPMSLGEPVTVLTANSEEIGRAIAGQAEAGEMDAGDVFKIDTWKRTGRRLRVEW